MNTPNTQQAAQKAQETASDPRAVALATHLECDPEDVEGDTYEERAYEAEGGEYLVLTHEEAEQLAKGQVRNNVWTFQSWFIADYCPESLTAEDIDSLRGDRCEEVNAALLALVDAGLGFDQFARGAIAIDGPGHFLAFYDGSENESECGRYLIFRTN